MKNWKGHIMKSAKRKKYTSAIFFYNGGLYAL